LIQSLQESIVIVTGILFYLNYRGSLGNRNLAK